MFPTFELEVPNSSLLLGLPLRTGRVGYLLTASRESRRRRHRISACTEQSRVLFLTVGAEVPNPVVLVVGDAGFVRLGNFLRSVWESARPVGSDDLAGSHGTWSGLTLVR